MIEERVQQLFSRFSHANAPEERYAVIIELGRAAPTLASEHRTAHNQVAGCQSIMYLRAYTEKGNIFYYAHSDALIANGLAALLITVYSGLPPQTILLTPPSYLEELAIPTSLSPGRANGLASLYARMKEEALQCLIKKNS